ncbi:exodeoxyribonuclease VII large subunit [Tsukamurella sp. 8F]|uniref:exodeoxyribonuclease VII large subunit n=1 Tax=unclassified Tsukamurella TaxID=2633480 RepID=UPI0023B9932D|nr:MULTISPECIES: exodeoxyribonuclease VII large subunit [unclassified Tsukamurella]MDF0530139.1 exodeoxyribonuclease VII large subunit [Tsukamurella sp. 8J]MDF0586457.1 exodeoxyribonuclease VII large subunit [Tsukamurella sp. 8F]
MTSPQGAGPSSPEHPWPVRVVAMKIAQWIDRLGEIWVEGQITQLNRRGTGTAFLTLRDPSANMSVQVSCNPQVLDRSEVPLTEGTQVIMRGKFSYWTGRGSLSLRVTEVRAVGIGELLARIERLRQLLHAEGLFDPRVKRPLPFLPRTVGLVTAKASAAERDVRSIAESRWPAVRFRTQYATVQGPNAVPQLLDALRALDRDPDVDVIVLARGGGSVEDLLPFSDEALCRAIHAATTPIVSAIGHEPDNPLCDHAADVRAATPTDAAKQVVPDVAAESTRVRELRERSRTALRGWVARETHVLAALRSRPVLADPMRTVDARADDVARLRRDARRDVTRLIDAEGSTVGHLAARLSALGPAATMARGYSIVQRVTPEGDSPVVRSVDELAPATQLRIRLPDGAARAAVMGVDRIPTTRAQEEQQ